MHRPPTERSPEADAFERAADAVHEDDVDAVRDAILARGEDVKQRQLRCAFDRLEARGTLTDDQRGTVTRLAEAVVDGVLDTPVSVLDDASRHDREAVQGVVDLFGPER